MLAMNDTTMVQALEQLTSMIEGVTEATSNLERAELTLGAYEYVRSTLQPAIAAERRAAFRGLRAEGYKLQEIADAVGITNSRVAQICG